MNSLVDVGWYDEAMRLLRAEEWLQAEAALRDVLAMNAPPEVPIRHMCRLFLGPGFRLAARWNRLGETVKTRKKRGKNGVKMGEIRPNELTV